MRWEEFVEKVKGLPVIETEALINECPWIRVQIARWEKSKKLLKVKRGIYVLNLPYRKKEIFEPHLAYILKNPSYLSLEKALEYHNLIPEGVPVFTSVTPKRQARFISELGIFDYRHISPSLFWGYHSINFKGQIGFVALPEKAFLDFIYLKRFQISPEFLEEMRLQNLEKISLKKLSEFARRFNKNYILRATQILVEYIKKNR